MKLEEVLQGSTHRFVAYFKDKVTGALMEMTDNTVKAMFYYGNTAVGTEQSTSKLATGTYYIDRYFLENETLGTWKVEIYGDAAGSGEKKKTVYRFILVDAYT